MPSADDDDDNEYTNRSEFANKLEMSEYTSEKEFQETVSPVSPPKNITSEVGYY